jgi:hypothetical protein
MFQQTIGIRRLRTVLVYLPICFYTLMSLPSSASQNKDRKLNQIFNSSIRNIDSGTGTVVPSGATEFTPGI